MTQLTLSAVRARDARAARSVRRADITHGERKQGAACPETYHGDRCMRPAGHDGLHTNGRLTWGFRDNRVPEWVRRAQARALPAKDLAR